MAIDNSTIESLAEALRQPQQATNNKYTAVVSRVDNEQTVWVRLAGSDKETPTASTSADVKAGDVVTVEWRNNKLYIAGNTSNPSAGIKVVHVVQQVAEEASEKSDIAYANSENAKSYAGSAYKIAADTNQHFWFVEEGTDTGAHITEIPKEDFIEDPEKGGGNLLARSNGIAVRDGLSELATFSSNGVEVGKNLLSHVRIDGSGLAGYGADDVPSYALQFSDEPYSTEVMVGIPTDFMEADITLTRAVMWEDSSEVPFKSTFESDGTVLKLGVGIEYGRFTSIDENVNFTSAEIASERIIAEAPDESFIYGTAKTVECSVTGTYVVGSATGIATYYYTLSYDGATTITAKVEGVNSNNYRLHGEILPHRFTGDATIYPSHLRVGTDKGDRGNFSATFGVGLSASREGQIACGRYNEAWANSLIEAGNGTAANPTTVFRVYKDGTVYSKGGYRLYGISSTDVPWGLFHDGTDLCIGSNGDSGHYGKTRIAAGTDPQTYKGYKSVKVSVNENQSLVDYDVLHVGYEPDVITPTITASVGAVNDATIVKYGRVVTFTGTFRKTSATAAGSNLFEGTMPVAYRPKSRVTGVGYYGSAAAVLQMTESGAMVVRATGAQIAANANVYLSVTYII